MRLKTASHRSADISNRSLHSGAFTCSALVYSGLLCSTHAEISVGEMPK